jgi:hypothetical protein
MKNTSKKTAAKCKLLLLQIRAIWIGMKQWWLVGHSGINGKNN